MYRQFILDTGGDITADTLSEKLADDKRRISAAHGEPKPVIVELLGKTVVAHRQDEKDAFEYDYDELAAMVPDGRIKKVPGRGLSVGSRSGV